MALILTRRPGEAVMVGDDIVFRIMGVSGTHVRVAVDAPRDIRIDREEVRERILAEGLNAEKAIS